MARITVLIPVYNGEAFLKETINSILRQTYQDFEVLCVDDASTDNSSTLIKEIMRESPKVKYIKNERNLGISSTRNLGIHMIQTEFIALLDQDDLSPSYRLEREIGFLDQNPEVDVVGGNQKSIDKEGREIGETWRVCHNPRYLRAFLMLSNTMSNGSTLIRKKFLSQYGILFKDQYYGVEDYRFWVDCSLNGILANIDEVMLYWRTGHEQETIKAKVKYKREREERIREIQRTALCGNGYELSEEQLQVLYKAFGEDAQIEDSVQLNALFEVLRALAGQAEQKQMENASEVKSMCRKRFGEKIGKAFYLWENRIDQ